MLSKLFFSKESIFLFLATILLSYYISPFFLNPQYDRQVFVYGSMTILKGGVPYKDFFDHKPPLIYVILALGWPLKWWGVWFVGVISKWLASIYLYKSAIKYDIVVPMLPSLIFLIVLLDPFLICLGSFTREYSSVFIAIALSVMLLTPGKNYIATGVLWALTFFTQQEEILALMPFTIWHLCTNENNGLIFKLKPFLWRIILMLIGFSLIGLPLMAWLYSKSALSAFWEDAFLFNFFSYPPNLTVEQRVSKAFKLLYHTRVGFFIALFILLHLYAFYKSRRFSVHLVSLITILLFAGYKIFFTRLGENYDAQHYLLAFSSIFATSLLLLQKEFMDTLQNSFLKASTVVIFFLCGWFLWENALTSKYTVKEEINYTRSKQILPLIEDVRNKDGQLYVFRNTSLIFLNNELNALSPSKWIFTTMYDQNLKFDPQQHVVKQIISDLDKNKTRYIVDMSEHDPLKNNPQMQNQWNEYVFQHYKTIFSGTDYKLWMRTF